jgi:hypothetical protein
MSDAVERLRKLAEGHNKELHHLRELLALHDEAVRVMRGLEDACSSVASWSEECLDYSDPARVAVRAFLAKVDGK